MNFAMGEPDDRRRLQVRYRASEEPDGRNRPRALVLACSSRLRHLGIHMDVGWRANFVTWRGGCTAESL